MRRRIFKTHSSTLKKESYSFLSVFGFWMAVHGCTLPVNPTYANIAQWYVELICVQLKIKTLDSCIMCIANVYAVYLLCSGIKVILFLFKTKQEFTFFAHHQLNEKRHPDTLLHHPWHLCLIHLQYLSCSANKLISSIVMLANTTANLLMNVYLL